jgi:hypothetical protein
LEYDKQDQQGKAAFNERNPQDMEGDTDIERRKSRNAPRNIIFKYNKVVSDFDIQSNTPTTWDCDTYKFCNSDFGHISTGNFDIIADKIIRNLFLKGRKYRITSEIDFNACCGQIAESVEDFSVKWCRRKIWKTRSTRKGGVQWTQRIVML